MCKRDFSYRISDSLWMKESRGPFPRDCNHSLITKGLCPITAQSPVFHSVSYSVDSIRLNFLNTAIVLFPTLS